MCATTRSNARSLSVPRASRRRGHSQGCYRALNGASYRNYEATFGKRGQFCPIPIPVQPNEHCYRACRQALLQSLPEFFMVLLQGSPSVQLLPHGSFSASNTAACWNSANCPAAFQSRSHVSGNKQDQLHETLKLKTGTYICVYAYSPNKRSEEAFLLAL